VTAPPRKYLPAPLRVIEWRDSALRQLGCSRYTRFRVEARLECGHYALLMPSSKAKRVRCKLCGEAAR
jgi:hypothetical protein